MMDMTCQYRILNILPLGIFHAQPKAYSFYQAHNKKGC
jgi:hypothetical protein